MPGTIPNPFSRFSASISAGLAPGRILSTSWRSGPEADRCATGPVLVSVTEFTPHRPWDTVGVVAAGLRLQQSWPRTEGAIGIRLWIDPHPLRMRSGAVSAWTGQPGLDGFVSRPDHLRIVRAFRGRGAVRSYSQELDAWEPSAAWESALRALSGEAPWPG
ncbi:hypothetical protein GXW83_08345 [Streptacidiphilus sp. PB12-B1b]|uniref:hypothetical protein n=1 Tax=Streptacidiphilus sp. PB12-B1b TaxID=2705012 RepID=UPI0015FC0B51|nr:hypothetical protein [Streptacidiphilus sp. PB12-B1b]QMU75749.1 hypothetical protein GXW83_08345 [Streptacidiphilus sp. PB12-B1b]